MKRSFNHADFTQPISYESMTLPEDSADGQVAATVGMMRRYALEDSRNPLVSNLAQEILSDCDDPQMFVAAVFDEVQSRMYFQRDEQTGQPIAGEDIVEVLIRPADVVALSNTQGQVPGDCDCFSMFGASLLLAGGVPCSFATAAADRSAPDNFSHVYLVAWPGTEYRTVVDASHGKSVGWEAPNCGRYQEWPVTTVSAGGASCILGLLLTLGGILLFMADQKERRESGATGLFAGELA